MAGRADLLGKPRQLDRHPEHGQGGYSEEQRLHLEKLALENLEDIEAAIEHELRDLLFELGEVRRRRADILAARACRCEPTVATVCSVGDFDDAEAL